ncbi:MAG TPA: hypothetical protein VK641_08760 [Terriglobales bacterium]|nr:hypothetical protein [Terriglobales bacterium]
MGVREILSIADHAMTTTIKQIARDPRQALRDLEIHLGCDPGDLLKDMERLSPPGEEWSGHLPYLLAAKNFFWARSRSLP